VQLVVGGQPFDGGDAAPMNLHGQHQTGFDDFAVQQHRAGAAGAGLAASLGAGQMQVVPQEIR
jgi:hypothetical protein